MNFSGVSPNRATWVAIGTWSQAFGPIQISSKSMSIGLGHHVHEGVKGQMGSRGGDAAPRYEAAFDAIAPGGHVGDLHLHRTTQPDGLNSHDLRQRDRARSAPGTCWGEHDVGDAPAPIILFGMEVAVDATEWMGRPGSHKSESYHVPGANLRFAYQKAGTSIRRLGIVGGRSRHARG